MALIRADAVTERDDPERDLWRDGPVAILLWRREASWRVVVATPNIRNILGYGAEEFLSGEIEFADLIHEQDNPKLFERVGLATAGGETEFTLRYRAIARDGSTRHILDRTRIRRDAAGEPTDFVSYLLDVTDDPRDEIGRDFVAHMSHEIRTPLSGVLGLVEALSATELDPRQADIVASIRDAGGSLLQLVNNVLDLGKLETGAMELSLSDFRLGELCIAAEKLFDSRAAAKGLTLTSRGQAMDISLRGDAGRLRQLLYNLVSNAVKFTHRGGVEIVWSCAPPDAEGRILARVSVADTGIGMTPETAARVFERYAQGGAEVAGEFGGTGLGLAISRELAELMGGRLWVESAPGQGSTFHFEATFEASRAEQADVIALEREEANAAARALIQRRAPRLLVAEDAQANQRVIELLFQPLNATVTIARDGREAVELFAAQRFDAVLMDSRMPRLGGVEAVIELRRIEREQGRARTPVIALSAETQDRTVAAFREAGVDDFLPKPFDPQRLYRALAALLAPGDAAF